MLCFDEWGPPGLTPEDICPFSVKQKYKKSAAGANM
jgi:hypothetical protein